MQAHSDLLKLFPLPASEYHEHPDFNTEYFHRCYLTRWNSGINTRNYENYVRDVRAAAGCNTFNKSKCFQISDREEASQRIINFINSRGWQIIFAGSGLIWALKLLEGFPVLCAEFRPSENEVGVTMEGDSIEVHTGFFEMMNLFPVGDLVHIEKITMAADGSLSRVGKFLPQTPDIVGKDYYYPWLGRSKDCYTLQSFADEFAASKSNALLLYGERGTGKSTFIRTLMFMMGRKYNFMITDEPTMRSQSFRNWMESAEEDSVIALEDADNLICSRESGNEAMVSLLNVTNGVIPKKCKIIISTNLPNLNRMDTALTRSGRMFAALNFEKLSADEANVVRLKDGLTEISYGGDSLTLAETLNFESLHREFKKTGIGFGSGM
jgi:hypothetical protein